VAFFFNVSFSYVIAYVKMLLVKRKPSHWLSTEMQIMETERRGRIRPTCATFEQEPWQNLSFTSGEAEPFAQYFFEN
jgi:hypothetical protein